MTDREFVASYPLEGLCKNRRNVTAFVERKALIRDIRWQLEDYNRLNGAVVLPLRR